MRANDDRSTRQAGSAGRARRGRRHPLAHRRAASLIGLVTHRRRVRAVHHHAHRPTTSDRRPAELRRPRARSSSRPTAPPATASNAAGYAATRPVPRSASAPPPSTSRSAPAACRCRCRARRRRRSRPQFTDDADAGSSRPTSRPWLPARRSRDAEVPRRQRATPPRAPSSSASTAPCATTSPAPAARSPRASSRPPLTGVSDQHIYEAMVTGPQNMPVFNDQNITPQEQGRHHHLPEVPREQPVARRIRARQPRPGRRGPVHLDLRPRRDRRPDRLDHREVQLDAADRPHAH